MGFIRKGHEGALLCLAFMLSEKLRSNETKGDTAAFPNRRTDRTVTTCSLDAMACHRHALHRVSVSNRDTRVCLLSNNGLLNECRADFDVKNLIVGSSSPAAVPSILKTGTTLMPTSLQSRQGVGAPDGARNQK